MKFSSLFTSALPIILFGCSKLATDDIVNSDTMSSHVKEKHVAEFDKTSKQEGHSLEYLKFAQYDHFERLSAFGTSTVVLRLEDQELTFTSLDTFKEFIMLERPDGYLLGFNRKGELTAEQHLENGKLHGSSIMFSNSRIVELFNFSKGRPNGVLRTFHHEGGIAAQLEFQNGAPHGTMELVDTSGTVLHRWFYKNGKRIAETAPQSLRGGP